MLAALLRPRVLERLAYLVDMCVMVAKSFYSELCRTGTGEYEDRAVALALHKAVVGLCESEEYGKPPLYWTQYVHYGA